MASSWRDCQADCLSTSRCVLHCVDLFKLAETNGSYWLACDAALIKTRSPQTWCQTTEEWRCLIQERRIPCLPCGAFGGNLLKPCDRNKATHPLQAKHEWRSINLIELTPWLSTNRCGDQCYFFLMSACLWHHLPLKTYRVASEHQQGCFLIWINLARQGLQDSVHPAEKESRPPDPDVASLASFPSPCFYVHFWGKCIGKVRWKCQKSPRKTILPATRLLDSLHVDFNLCENKLMHKIMWKHNWQISCDIANIELAWRLFTLTATFRFPHLAQQYGGNNNS